MRLLANGNISWGDILKQNTYGTYICIIHCESETVFTYPHDPDDPVKVFREDFRQSESDSLERREETVWYKDVCDWGVIVTLQTA